MKKEYESPVLEVLHFNIQEPVMNSDCTTYEGVCPIDGVCTYDIGDGIVSGVG